MVQRDTGERVLEFGEGREGAVRKGRTEGTDHKGSHPGKKGKEENVSGHPRP